LKKILKKTVAKANIVADGACITTPGFSIAHRFAYKNASNPGGFLAIKLHILPKTV